MWEVEARFSNIIISKNNDLTVANGALCSRLDQYWQIAYPKFFVAQNCIKKVLEI